MDEVKESMAHRFYNGMRPELAPSYPQCENAVEIALQAIKDAGMVIVPRVPSEAMLKAATSEGLNGHGVSSVGGGWHGHMGRIYTAMIEAHEAQSD